MLRSEYVLKTVFNALNSVHNNIIDPSQYGWRIDDSVISIVWDDDETMKAVLESKGCGCNGAKCDGSTAGCRNCYRMCKPCIVVLGVSIKVFVATPIIIMEPVNQMMKVTTVLLMMNKLLRHYHLYPAMLKL